MEKELDSRIFMLNDYASKSNMEEQIKKYIRKLKSEHPSACITKEFYKGENILVRATEINSINNKQKANVKEKSREDDWYIRQRGER
ncbi:MAG: hypothetical protein IJE05_07455 [Clostridia bacterium]|nr:hypothetical protein [Clostridia bacterium]